MFSPGRDKASRDLGSTGALRLVLLALLVIIVTKFYDFDNYSDHLYLTIQE